MEKRVKLIIADDEPFICGMLQKLIDFEALGLRLVDCANDGETLLAKIEQMHPDIVLTDISMPRLDGLEVIRRAREKGITCRFIIISGYKQFEYAYNALKYDVDDYILKPVDGKELNRVLLKLCSGICHSNLIDEDQENSDLYEYLIETAPHEELRSSALSLDEINRTFRTTFQNGWFQMLLLKLDFSRDESQTKEDVSSVVNKLRDLTKTFFSEMCYDVVMSDKKDGVLFLLNYAKEREPEIRKSIHGIFVEAKNVADLFNGFNLTICVGKAVDQTRQIEEAKRSCRRATWLRLHYGLNQIIYAEQMEEPDSVGYIVPFKEIRESLEQSFTAIDKRAMETNLERFFAMPLPVLCSTQAMQFIRDMVAHFAEVYCRAVKETNTERVRKSIMKRLHMQTSFANYREELIAQLSFYMTEMARVVSEKNVKPVRQVYAYIEKHYAEHLSLESVAEEVGLSPVYLSNLFKKESGQNFTEYLTAYRMKKAKEMLRAGDRNVNEIAEALGYTDARYFSKVFKKEVGVKPTDYRKIYG